MKFKIAENYLS